MSECFIGEIRMFSGNYAPENWAMCNGQLLNISDNNVLFAVIGTTYGGDGKTTFALPDLRGRVPIHQSATYPMGQRAGTENVTLLVAELPVHTHEAQVQSAAGTTNNRANAFWAGTATNSFAVATTGLAPMSPKAVTAAGGSQAHENMMPFNTISFIIATAGIYPTRN